MEFQDPDIVGFALHSDGIALEVNTENILDSLGDDDEEAVMFLCLPEINALIGMPRNDAPYKHVSRVSLKHRDYYVNSLDQLLVAFNRSDLGKLVNSGCDKSVVFLPFIDLVALVRRIAIFKV